MCVCVRMFVFFPHMDFICGQNTYTHTPRHTAQYTPREKPCQICLRACVSVCAVITCNVYYCSIIVNIDCMLHVNILEHTEHTMLLNTMAPIKCKHIAISILLQHSRLFTYTHTFTLQKAMRSGFCTMSVSFSPTQIERRWRKQAIAGF